VSFPAAVAIFGSGGFARDLGNGLYSAGIRIDAYLDWSSGTSPSVGPRVGYLDYENRAVPVLLGINNPYADSRKILAALGEAGFTNVLSPVNAVKLLAGVGGSLESFWLSTREVQQDEPPAGRWDLLPLLLDDDSKSTFKNIQEYRQTGEFSRIPKPLPLIEQYFAPDLKSFIDYSSFIDVGAFDGDTIKSITGNQVRVKEYLGFEPDDKNFLESKKALAASGLAGEIFPFGCSKLDSEVSFTNTGDSSSAIDPSGSHRVRVINLDSFLAKRSFVPTFIKMDIEGSELDALLGLRETISTHSPVLALSVYHKPHDLHDIPKFIFEVNESYRFHIRTYGFNTFETVLYAIPTSSN
jgi:FkbM family methyltransferase